MKDVSVKVISSRKAADTLTKILKVVIPASCILLSLWAARDLVLDVVSGTDDDGNRIRVETSKDDYTRLSYKREVTIEYYEHADRIVNYR